ncbi:protein phosphatase 2C domain-containing protein [Streptomyces sp. NPDC012888]|uniref:protein phosphatase 2C domain-containing protein n=1 Tax=Streptomyces sp. NPDC012888 TaxID=3364855 RepID=UPI0036A33510
MRDANGPAGPLWDTLQATRRGVNKALNQDRCRVAGTGTAGDPLVLAVADGHGSAAHARSHVGAQYAVEVFAEKAREFGRLARAAGDGEVRPSLGWLMHYAQDSLPRRLVGAWQRKALRHWERFPCGDASRPDAEKLRLYGSTLVGAVLTPELFAAWQLGDGELAVVEEDGALWLPLAPGEAELGDETESLCSTQQAWQLVRTYWAPITDPSRTPRLITLSTDGLSKSFAAGEGFSAFVTGLDQRLAESGAAEVRAALPEWLAEASRHSGDDTTLVAARRNPPYRGSADTKPTE